MLILNPLEQFSLLTLIPIEFLGINISITNATLFLFLTAFLAYGSFRLAMLNATVVPNSWQYVAESLYNFINEELAKKLIANDKGREHRS